ncbi:ecto-NOX disulfide-thiol exchanger 2 [Biomphalaria pfeifferi]|uniref:Ecto-NOX disulfide-thiol exchanger 2 n=1 Tax=Biomphalaria pfeifferi TaxID=112525 RepID=A0AAD8FEL1_BIOPF|nr:ecto-NOX disulfide-thiol exchanger 2 [Biomphalaria pfeifferi]
MDFSDDEDSSPAKKRKTGAHSVSDSIESQKLKEENDALKCQMEAFKNEVDMVRQEWRTDVEDKDKQIKALQNALQGMQQQLIAHRAAASRLELEREEKKSERKEDSGKPPEEGKSSTEEKEEETPSAKLSTKEDITVSSSGLTLTDKEAKLIGLICCFLHVHPHGATVDYLWSYLRQILPVRTREVEDLLEKMPSIFDQEIIGVGAAIERRWIFTALKRGAALSSP